MKIAKNRTLPTILTGLALIAYNPMTHGVGQVSSNVAVSSAQEDANLDSLLANWIVRIKEYNNITGDFVPNESYVAIGHNEEIKSDVKFIYTQSGDEAILRVVLLGEKYKRPAKAVVDDADIREGSAYLQFIFHRNGQNFETDPDVNERVEIGKNTGDTPISRFRLAAISDDPKKLYRLALLATKLQKL